MADSALGSSSVGGAVYDIPIKLMVGRAAKDPVEAMKIMGKSYKAGES